jgi:hypothetical protein
MTQQFITQNQMWETITTHRFRHKLFSGKLEKEDHPDYDTITVQTRQGTDLGRFILHKSTKMAFFQINVN